MLITSSLAASVYSWIADKIASDESSIGRLAVIRQTLHGLAYPQASPRLPDHVLRLRIGPGGSRSQHHPFRQEHHTLHGSARPRSRSVITLATMGVTVLPCGALADRVGVKKMLAAGLGLIALAAFMGMWVKTLPETWVVMVIAGIGTACQERVFIPASDTPRTAA